MTPPLSHSLEAGSLNVRKSNCEKCRDIELGKMLGSRIVKNVGKSNCENVGKSNCENVGKSNCIIPEVDRFQIDQGSDFGWNSQYIGKT